MHDTRVWIVIQDIQNTMHTHYTYIMPLLYNISLYGLLSKPGEDPRNPLKPNTAYKRLHNAKSQTPVYIDYIRYKITNWQRKYC